MFQIGDALPKLFRSGREDHFAEQLFREYRYLMFSTAMRVTKNAHDAEDIVSDSCEKMIKNADEMKRLSGYKLPRYIVSVVRNTAIDYVRKRNRQNGYYFLTDDENSYADVQDDRMNVEADLLHAESITTLKQALAQLDEKDFEILRMKYYLELSDREIAEKFGIQPASVRMGLSRARKKLKCIMEVEK